MIPRFKKKKKPDELNNNLNKEDFLKEHNKLSPENLKATIPLLSRFKLEKKSLFKSDKWPMEKIRRPFILWLTSQGLKKKLKQKDNK
jgi:hypothetical protein